MRVAQGGIALALVMLTLLTRWDCSGPHLGQPVHAGDYVGVDVGTTDEILPNSAYHQSKHYLKQDADLCGRIAALMEDVDCLLANLHALPPELSGSAMLDYPVDNELGGLYAIALENNPELKPLRTQEAVLAARTRQEGAKQDPMLALTLDDYPTPLPIVTHMGETNWAFSISQEFESYGKRGLKREIAHWDEVLQEYELKQREYEMLLDVTEKYYDLDGTEARLRSLEQNIQLMGVLIELATRKFSVGATPQAAVLSAQVQLSQMEAMRIELTNLREQQRVRLSELLGRPEGFDPATLTFPAAYPLPPKVEWDNDELIPHALEHRPDYQKLEAMAEQQGLQLELAHREYRPDYKLTAQYKVGYANEDSVMAMVEMPLFTHKEERQDAKLQETYAMQAVTQDEVDAVENSFAGKLLELQYELKMHGELVELYRTALVPQARLNLDSNIAAYSAGMMDLSDLIMAQQTLLTQEQELEQNYIHIIHTLTDLQIVTCGAFDPEPYLVPAKDTLGKSGSALDSANRALAEEALSELSAGESPAQSPELDKPVPPDLFPNDSQPAAGDSFIDSLKLPAVPDVKPKVQDKPETEGKTRPEKSAPPGDAFYQPFEPKPAEAADGAEKADDQDKPDADADPKSDGQEDGDEH